MPMHPAAGQRDESASHTTINPPRRAGYTRTRDSHQPVTRDPSFRSRRSISISPPPVRIAPPHLLIKVPRPTTPTRGQGGVPDGVAGVTSRPRRLRASSRLLSKSHERALRFGVQTRTRRAQRRDSRNGRDAGRTPPADATSGAYAIASCCHLQRRERYRGGKAATRPAATASHATRRRQPDGGGRSHSCASTVVGARSVCDALLVAGEVVHTISSDSD